MATAPAGDFIVHLINLFRLDGFSVLSASVGSRFVAQCDPPPPVLVVIGDISCCRSALARGAEWWPRLRTCPDAH